MTETVPQRRPTDHAHVDDRTERDRTPDATYPIAVYAEGSEYVATQADATLEARGHSAAEAIANYALAVEAQNDGADVVSGE
ncbi:hypothetical protein [Natrinema thermotolerans]|uniref:hypothetical protein n=1 Tax=Natrinema thermotolerans TaxID=121872 RepID=UPI000678520B|nr:hypothetical protein [Natrinema thermotolerans]QCC57251.1 hypothetical protein DVR14_00835 [Natrinema thermotolerans]